MVKLKIRNITLLTEMQTKMVSGGAAAADTDTCTPGTGGTCNSCDACDTSANKATLGCPPTTSDECPTQQCPGHTDQQCT